MSPRSYSTDEAPAPDSHAVDPKQSQTAAIPSAQLLPPPPVGPLPLDPGSLDSSTAGSSAAAIARSAASSLAFIFKRPPLRFFRPVKISTYGALQAMAQERGRPVSIKFVQSVIRREGPWKFILNHALPPFCFNTVIGLTLFTTYTAAENHLLKPDRDLHPYLVPALAGGLAGIAQSLISNPLDNLRLLQVTAAHKHFKGWIPLLKQVMLPLSFTASCANLEPSERARLWASRGWGMVGLSVVKDCLGFATFFTIFQIGRDWGRRLGSTVDRSMHIVSSQCPEEDGEVVGDRGWTGRILQSCVIVLSGATAGWAYGIVAEPFETLRRSLWLARLQWAAIHHPYNSYPSKLANKPSSHPLQSRHHSSLMSYFKEKHPRSYFFWRSKKSKLVPLSSIPKNRNSSMVQKMTKGIDQAPTILTILKQKIDKNRGRGWGLMEAMISVVTSGKSRPTDSSATQGMKMQDVGGTGSSSSSSGGRLYPPRAPRFIHRKGPAHGSPPPAARVTRFRSFILSPYSLGFFVWAVCSGDLSLL
ncbi:hypothetical protein VP01_776g4 [Puccinia sorghi]|uniref:Mitochondrial carrier n=1 Tax=Puccinia sorghi TaxID=27349 RepID=A0A0L6UC81_9BASI|nr:hypothetical protein VP01_776g4 [Puccinia sorghi]